MCVFVWLKVLKNGPSAEEKQVNGENKGPNKNEDVLIKVSFVCKLHLSQHLITEF